MARFEHIPLGQPIPPTAHAVSCSLPTMRAVRGYEEKDPEIVAHLISGYPRFVLHPLVRELTGYLASEAKLAGRTLWLTCSASMADSLARSLSEAPGGGVDAARDVGLFSAGDIHGVTHPEAPAIAARAKGFLQNVGGFMASREAEDHLARLGLIAEIQKEEGFSGDAEQEVRGRIRAALPGTADRDLFLANCGMNAVFSAFQAASELQSERGRTVWVQLGWLYLDTIAILKRFTATPDDYVYVRDVFDLAALERLFQEKGGRIAGVVTEIPTNPLIQTPEVGALGKLCRRHRALLILDPSVASVFSVNVLSDADIVVNSLTKYTGSDGDIVAGLAAINPSGPDAAELRRRVGSWVEPIYPRDLARLAEEMHDTEALLSHLDSATPAVATFLEGHPGVKEVFWALSPRSKDNYRRIARRPDAVGGMISFSLRGSLETFYDRLRLPKGPSFGMKTTLICPFMYLAHYDMVSTPAGRAELLANGLDPDLLRLCVGNEPVDEIIASLDEAFGP
jgi:cystathionine gamma-synthase